MAEKNYKRKSVKESKATSKKGISKKTASKKTTSKTYEKLRKRSYWKIIVPSLIILLALGYLVYSQAVGDNLVKFESAAFGEEDIIEIYGEKGAGTNTIPRSYGSSNEAYITGDCSPEILVAYNLQGEFDSFVNNYPDCVSGVYECNPDDRCCDSNGNTITYGGGGSGDAGFIAWNTDFSDDTSGPGGGPNYCRECRDAEVCSGNDGVDTYIETKEQCRDQNGGLTCRSDTCRDGDSCNWSYDYCKVTRYTCSSGSCTGSTYQSGTCNSRQCDSCDCSNYC